MDMSEAAVWKGPRKLSGHISGITSLAFSPDKRFLVSGSRDRTVWLWDVESGKEILIRAGHDSDVTSVAYSPDGTVFASGSRDETVRIWDAVSGKELFVLAGHCKEVTSVAFSPDSHTLASGSKDGTVLLWDVDSGCERGLLPKTGHLGEVDAVAFSPVGARIAASSRNNRIWIWDAATGDQVRVMPKEEDKKRWGWPVLSLAFSPDGSLLASHSMEYQQQPGNKYQQSQVGKLKVWDLATGECLSPYPKPARSLQFKGVSFTRDGRVFFLDDGNKAKLCEARTGEEQLVGEIAPIKPWGFQTAICSLDGKTVAGSLTSLDGDILLWELTTP